ncbi:MAG: leucine-rich repeat domain-containing protein [Clostridia bacterium]|nr:leucine-rich repeat domain-containing protein [Clostridia bacterium]
MKNTDLFAAVSNIDESLIERSYNAMNGSRKRIPIVIKRAAIAAACIAIAISSILVIKRGGAPAVIDKDGFHIENGVLISYSGDESDVVIPDEVECIADFAFADNPNVEEITAVHLGTSVKRIDINAFAGLKYLKEIDVYEKNDSFVWSDGLLLSADGTVLLRYEREGESLFKIPDTVRYVAAYAVYSDSLIEIDFGSKLVAIGNYAFSNITGLKSIMLPDTVEYIGEGAFYGCRSAVEGHIPKNAAVGESAFEMVPFYNSAIAGEICPGEEIARGLINPSGAFLKSDLSAFTDEVDIILSGMRGELEDVDWDSLTSVQQYAFSAVEDAPEKPGDLFVPDGFEFGELFFDDDGWEGYGGGYDLRVFLPCGDYEIVMEAYAYTAFFELNWKDVVFFIDNVYYLRVAGPADPSCSYSEFGWNAQYEHIEETYSGLVFVHEDGRIVYDNYRHESSEPFSFRFSPDGTRVAVEYTCDFEPCFFIVALNGDKLEDDRFIINDYVNMFSGKYCENTLRWTDNDNLEGENVFGHFTFNIFERFPTQDAAIGNVCSDLAVPVSILMMTASQIREAYGMSLEYTDYGPDHNVVYSSADYWVVFSRSDIGKIHRDKMTPREVILDSDFPDYEYAVEKTDVAEYGIAWDGCVFDASSEEIVLEKRFSGFTVYIHVTAVGKDLPADPDSAEFSQWFADYMKSPTGIISQIRVVNNEKEPSSSADPKNDDYATYELDPIGAGKDNDTEYLDRIGRLEKTIKDGDCIAVGNIRIRVSVDGDDGSKSVVARSVEAYGQKIYYYSYDEAIKINGPYLLQACEADKYAVVANTYYENGDSYIFTREGFIHISPPVCEKGEEESYYSSSGISFYEKDGHLCYQRIPLKSQVLVHQVYGGLMEYCVARDELYRESGRAEIENGEIVYYPEKTETVSDAFDLELEYSRWQENVGNSDQFPNMTEMTLDEYLAENAKLHKRAY